MVNSKRTVEEGLRVQMKTIVRNVIRVTPPGHFVQTDTGNSIIAGGAALKAGKNAIKTDLLGGRRSDGGSKRYGVFMVIGDDLINKRFGSDPVTGDFHRLWVTKDGSVYGTQQHFYRPDASIQEMAAHHRQYFKNGRMSSAGSYTRDVGRWKWIDQMIVSKASWTAYYNEAVSRVFWLAAGWKAAAAEFGVSVPKSIAKHNAPGSVRIEVSETVIRFVIINQVTYANGIRDMERRVQWAIDAQTRNMSKQLTKMLETAAKRAGLTVVGTIAS
jgi:hypothetical protein